MTSSQNAAMSHLSPYETVTMASSKFSESMPAGPSNHETSWTAPQQFSTEDAYVDDGPLFRATIAQLESRTSALRLQVKRILKAATASLEARRLCLETDEAFVAALRETPCVQPLFTQYIDHTWNKTYELQLRLQHSMQSLLIDPLQKLYDCDVKVADTKRKQFEEESKEYYAYLAKYLSIKKSGKQAESDAKHLAKKGHFDLIRFDYYTFLMDLHGGKKEQELLYHLLAYWQRQFTYEQNVADVVLPFKSGLDNLAAMMMDASREQTALNKERSEKRKLLANKYAKGDTVDASGSAPPKDLLAVTTSAEPVGLGISDLQQHKEPGPGNGRRKEGFLFATSKPTKTSTTTFDKPSGVGWHKYWCVLSGGQLHEYSNWKTQLQRHLEPINLRFATAREARNMDRRFCFEIITPQFRRVYQATSQEEMQSWVATVNNAIESTLNGMSSSIKLANKTRQDAGHDRAPDPKLQDALTQNLTKRHSRSFSGALRNGVTKEKLARKRQSQGSAESVEAPTTESRFRWSGLGFGKSNTSNQPYNSPIPDSVTNTRLISQLRQDPSNTVCADCGNANPEWCSLNLGILLCIECSGIHRSLGTHISKVRSLTLDSTSFTPDIIALLRSVGNARANAVWDPRHLSDHHLDKPRIKPDDSRETKLKYIQAKYVERAFVEGRGISDANELLFDAIDQDDIPTAAYALALGANVNGKRTSAVRSKSCIKNRIDSMSHAELSSATLRMYMAADGFLWNLDDHDEHKPSSNIHDVKQYPLLAALIHSRIVHDIGDRDWVFPMAEFLLQNGADASIYDPATGCTLAELAAQSDILGDEAIEYLNMKNSARGQSLVTRLSMPPPSRTHNDLIP